MLRNALRNFIKFPRLLRRTPPVKPGVSNVGAKRARQAMHVNRGSGSSGRQLPR